MKQRKQKILTFEKLEAVNVYHFCSKDPNYLDKMENRFLMLSYVLVIFPRLTQTSIFSTKRIHVLSPWTCTQPDDSFSLFSDGFGNLSLSLCTSLSISPLFQSMALAWLQSHLPCAKLTSITSVNHQHASSTACWTGLCGEPCCQGLGGVLLGTSRLLQCLWWPPGEWQCVGSPAARWSSRPSMTTATAGLMDGKSASGRANGSFSWKRPTLTGGRWENSSSIVCLASVEPKILEKKGHLQRSIGFWRAVSEFEFVVKNTGNILHFCYCQQIPWKDPKPTMSDSSLNTFEHQFYTVWWFNLLYNNALYFIYSLVQ